MSEHLSNLGKIAPLFDVFFIDIYGVIYDGRSPYPGVIRCLRHLSEAGKSVLLLTNSPLRSQVIAKHLEAMGIPLSLYQHLISSGEVTYAHLHDRPDSWYSHLGEKCYFIGPSHSSLLDGLNIYLVSDIEEADFLVVAGPDDWHSGIADYKDILVAAVAKGLPLICANPNLGDVHKAQAGDIAEYYQHLGGEVHSHGKPYPSFFRAALRRFPNVNRDKILVIGDALDSDIKGALAVHLNCAFVTGGQHSIELGASYGNPAKPKAIQHLLENHQLYPTYTIPGLIC